VPVLRGARRQLVDPAAGERRQILHRPLQRGERRPPRLVGQRDGHLSSTGEALQECPFGARQVLEAVREDRATVPRRELGAEALDRATAQDVPIPQPERVQLGPVGGVESGQIPVQLLRLEQAGFELGECGEECVREAAEAGRATEPVQRRSDEGSADDQRPLCLARNGADIERVQRQLPEEVVEGADRPRQERPGPPQEIALDPFDVRRIRNDQDGVELTRVEIRLEQPGNLAGLRRPHDESETHPTILVRASVGSRAREPGSSSKERESGRTLRPPFLPRHRLRSAAATCDLPAAHLLGLGVSDVELADALARVVERDPDRRTLAVGDLRAGHVGYENGLASHWESSLEYGKSRVTIHATRGGITLPVVLVVFATSERG